MTSRHADKSNGERRLVNHQVMSQRSHDSKLTPQQWAIVLSVESLDFPYREAQGSAGVRELAASRLTKLKGAMSSQPRATPGSCLPTAKLHLRSKHSPLTPTVSAWGGSGSGGRRLMGKLQPLQGPHWYHHRVLPCLVCYSVKRNTF